MPLSTESGPSSFFPIMSASRIKGSACSDRPWHFSAPARFASVPADSTFILPCALTCMASCRRNSSSTSSYRPCSLQQNAIKRRYFAVTGPSGPNLFSANSRARSPRQNVSRESRDTFVRWSNQSQTSRCTLPISRLVKEKTGDTASDVSRCFFKGA